MAKDLSRHQQKIVQRYYEHQETIRADKLSDIVAELWLCEDEAKATRLWGRVQTALMRAGANPQQAATVVGKRDIEGLARLVQQVDAGQVKPRPKSQDDEEEGANPRHASVADGRTVGEMRRDRQAQSGTDSLEAGNLRRAMNAFKQKVKSLKRDDESRLGGRYVTRGGSSGIVAITPPREFPTAVWEELVRQGRLKRAGQGMYQIP